MAGLIRHNTMIKKLEGNIAALDAQLKKVDDDAEKKKAPLLRQRTLWAKTLEEAKAMEPALPFPEKEAVTEGEGEKLPLLDAIDKAGKADSEAEKTGEEEGEGDKTDATESEPTDTEEEEKAPAKSHSKKSANGKR
jgi:hypothetical protein